MVRKRIIETDSGIQGEFQVNSFDQMQRRFRDKGWMETTEIIKSGISKGSVLEIGPGPGYLGLEWLKNTKDTYLHGLDISPDMIAVAERNAKEYNLLDRIKYIQSSGAEMPFEDNHFDAVFSNGSLHEWSDPAKTFKEIGRILKAGGRIFISDLRRDMNFLLKWFLWLNTKPKVIRSGLLTSINASYIALEIIEKIKETPLTNCIVTSNLIGIKIQGVVSN